MRRPRDWPARLRLDPTAFVAPGAVVVGAVSLGSRSSVWFNTVIRGDSAAIEIGEESNVQDNSTVHVDEGQPAWVGARVTIGHRAVVHGCTIEDECLIGMGAVVLSGARIGAGSLVGAGALVREGQVVPPGSLAVGAPARVVGPVARAHREAIARGTAHYVELSRSYLARGFARPHPAADSDTGLLPQAHTPMRFQEWERLLAMLTDVPERVEELLSSAAEDRWRHAPRDGEPSAAALLAALAAMDRQQRLPALERMLGADQPVLLPAGRVAGGEERGRAVPTAGARARAAALAAWRADRGALLARLRPLGPPEWERLAFHAVRGPWTLGAMVRDWAEQDLEACWRMGRALGETG
jgi:carbonic anhydrase/acetyltransferase-like protein (isoleucine patch superfamily)